MCDSPCLVGAVSTNILTPYGVKTAFAGKRGKYCVKFLRNGVLQNTYFATPVCMGWREEAALEKGEKRQQGKGA